VRPRPSRGRPGNQVELLENGEAFFPAVFAAIDGAEREVLIETFILWEDKVGVALRDALLRATARGVHVEVTVDGFGSGELTPEFTSTLAAAGIRLYVFDPRARILGVRTNWFRRMHRKLVVVDGTLAFVGGINFSADHLADFGPEAKQDYAVSVRGPVVADIHRFMREQIADGHRHAGDAAPQRGRDWLHPWRRARGEPAAPPPPAGTMETQFVVRDNREHRTDIERHYRAAIRTARRDVTIANAYFFPGWRLLNALRKAARRGVQVRLILQGEPDMAIVKTAAGLLYDHLQRAGVRIYEYCERPLHGKVAVVDDAWSTVGSSNLDPLSLSLNLEANLVIRDAGFAAVLRGRLEHLIEHSCREVCSQRLPTPRWWEIVRSAVVFHVLRRFPAWAGLLPAHQPVLAPAEPGTPETQGPGARVTEGGHGGAHADHGVAAAPGASQGAGPPLADRPGVESVTEPADR